MKVSYDVKRLIRLIKTLPIVIAVLFSIVTTYLIIYNNVTKHDENIKKIKADYIYEHKIIIKKEVLRTLNQILYQKNLAEENLKKDIKTRVLTAHGILNNLYEENQHKSKKEIIKIIKDALRPIRFNDGRGYFFIYTIDGVNVLFPTAPQYEGENLSNLKDLKGLYTIKELSKIAKEKSEGFLSWHWYRPIEDEQLGKKMYKKIGYAKYIKELNWFIGTGEYVEDFENSMQENLLKEIQQIRYGKNGHIFIHQYDGKLISHMNQKSVGQNKFKSNNKDEKSSLENIILTAKNGGGYVKHIDYNVEKTDNNPAEKLSYIIGMDDWEWQIGAGFYLNDINTLIEKKEKEFQEKFNEWIMTTIIIGLIITMILVFVMLKILKIIEKEFGKYEQSLSEQIIENHKKDKLISEQSKLASMGEMLANISHQWRQPLSVISTAATGMKMQKEYNCLSDDVFLNTCDAINNNAQYLSKTIDDFQNFIKGDTLVKSFDLKDTIDSFLLLVDSSIKKYGIVIDLDLDDDLQIKSHENELIQCLMTIFNNSKDAFIEVEENNRNISIVVQKKKKFVIIVIKDNAGGIKKDIISKVFEPYFTTKHKSQGTGLGLHMTYNLVVDGLKGTIEVSNVKYKDSKDNDCYGASFEIVLPRT